MGLKHLVCALVATAFLAAGGYRAFAAEKTEGELRVQANKAQQAGNFKDAYEVYRKLTADPRTDPGQVSGDLTNGINCLERLGRWDEIDDFREKAIATHGDNWRLLQTAAETYQNVEHTGFIVAGKFLRGGRHEGTGKVVHAFERDRVRALQLMEQAAKKAENEAQKHPVAELYFRFADMLLDRRYGQGAWRLQYLSDLSKLPDYEDGYPYYYYGGGNNRGAPVDEDGKPVYHKTPKSWQESKTDGERWRWCLLQAQELSPGVKWRARTIFAAFLHEQFGVQTMLDYSYRPMRMGRGMGAAAALPGPEQPDDTRKDESGPYAVFSLKDNETIGRLANGVKRFELPDEFNYIKIFQEIGEAAPQPEGEMALNTLAGIYADRQQYDRSVDYWKRSIAKFGDPHSGKKQQIEQILGNWVLFDPSQTAPAGTEPRLSFLFRNGKKVSFTAHEVNVQKLLDDVKAYIKSKPAQLNWQEMQIDNLGHRLRHGLSGELDFGPWEALCKRPVALE